MARREAWARAREGKAERAFNGARAAVDGIPPGQPILVGHHSERRHRAALERHDARMRAGIESEDMAKHHAAKAAGLADALERSIFSDDPDAVERLREKVAAIEAQLAMMKRANAAHRKGKGAPGWALSVFEGDPDAAKKAEGLEATFRRLVESCPYETRPFPAYALSNANAERRRAEKRIIEVQRRARVQAAANEAGGCLVEVHPAGHSIVIRFAEAPAFAVREKLKAAGFSYGGGAWSRYAYPSWSTGLDEQFRRAMSNAGAELPEVTPEEEALGSVRAMAIGLPEPEPQEGGADVVS